MTQLDFISKVAPAAVEDMRVHKVPASLTIAQAILESSWGTSELATKAFNLFGIKGTGPAGFYAKVSDEFINGEKIQKESNFRKYRSWSESINDHTTFLLKPRYAKVIGSDWKTACKEIHAAGYATDPAYPEKLMRLIEQYMLFEYDQVGEKEMSVPILIIDPGHGGVDPGAVGNGLNEKDLTLQISNYQYARFKALNVPVVLTRTTDVYLSSEQRTKIVKDSGAKFCLSNHINAGGGQGVETIHSIHSDGKLAKAIYDEIVKAGQIGRRVYSKVHSPQNPRLDYYYMHRETGSVETIITEYGFIDNAADAQKLKDKWQTYAEAVVKAFCAFLGMPYTAPITNPQNPANPVDKPVDNATREALKALQAAGEINTPDYWLENAREGGMVRGDFVALILQRFAKRVQRSTPTPVPTPEPSPEPNPDPKPDQPKTDQELERLASDASVYFEVGYKNGSGVLVEGGHILTAAHVAGRNDMRIQTRDGAWHPIRLVARHPEADIALCAFGNGAPRGTYLPLSTRTVQSGQKLVSVGHGRGKKWQKETGTVDRVTTSDKPHEFDCSVYGEPDDSGSGILNEHGEVCGIVVQYAKVNVKNGNSWERADGCEAVNVAHPLIRDWLKQYVK